MASLAARGFRTGKLSEEEIRTVCGSALTQREPLTPRIIAPDSELETELAALKAENESLRGQVSWYANKGTGNA